LKIQIVNSDPVLNQPIVQDIWLKYDHLVESPLKSAKEGLSLQVLLFRPPS